MVAPLGAGAHNVGARQPAIDIELSSIFPFPQDRWLVCGSKGGLHGTGSKLEWKWVDFSTMPEREVELASTPDRSYNYEKLVCRVAAQPVPSVVLLSAG